MAMRFMLMFKPDKEPEPGVHACKQNLPEMAKLMGELRQSGVLVDTQGLMSSDTGARVRLSNGKLTVRDGPFAEAKELIAGVALVEVRSKAEAVELAKRFLAIAGGGEGDVLQVLEAPEAGH